MTTNAYYATGAWLNSSHLAYFTEDNQTLSYVGTSPEKQTNLALFCPDQGMCPDPNLNPSQIHDYHWLQAVPPKSLHGRFTRITQDSGKFLVFVHKSQIDAIWAKFKSAYEEGKLGYGLRASTQKVNVNCSTENLLSGNSLITVHLENSFDKNEVARAAWEINQLLHPWEGVLQYMTDKETKAMVGPWPISQGMLYSISSRSFKINAINGGQEKKTVEHFTNWFRLKFK